MRRFLIFMALFLVGCGNDTPSNNDDNAMAASNAENVVKASAPYIPSQAEKDKFKKVWLTQLMEMSQCFLSKEPINEALTAHDIQRAYDSAKEGAQSCMAFSTDMDTNVSFSFVKDVKTKEKFDEALSYCKLSLGFRSDAFAKTAVSINEGNVSPAEFDDIKQAYDDADRNKAKCSSDLRKAAVQSGLQK